MKRIKVAIVDDHKIFVQGLSSLLGDSEEIEVVLQCYDGNHLLEELKEVEVDMVIMDLQMPNLNGFDTTEFLSRKYPKLHVLALSMHKEESFIIKIMELGARGYLQKDVEIDQIEKALLSIRNSGYYFTNALSTIMLKKIAKNDKIKPHYFDLTLSERELIILLMICDEKTNTEIGESLCISKRTVDGHRTRLLEKIGAKNTAGLVVYAVKNDLYEIL
jgi:DNA-binding NarL/FixJ family response regulator